MAARIRVSTPLIEDLLFLNECKIVGAEFDYERDTIIFHVTGPTIPANADEVRCEITERRRTITFKAA